MASSSSPAATHETDKYEVFISFRGSDVRRGFLSHLYPALTARQIHAFIDSDLVRGTDITRNLFRIIEQSDLSIVIFSHNYPKSEWCLEELEKIHESMNQKKQIVVPIFYEVEPSDVQDLKGNYAVELQKWRDALVEISNLSGFDSRNSINDAKLIEDIVVNVCNKLSEMCPPITYEDGLFGIDSSIKDVESLLGLDSRDDVRMVGIWGMGGIGKTTIATKVFDKIKNNFSGHCFVSNVRETLSKDGLTKLRDKIIQEILKDKNICIDSPFSVDDSIRRRLKHVKVVLVLDDVDTCMHLNSLLESSGLFSSESFCPGSRIIVTSRDSQVLGDVRLESVIYEAKELRYMEALRLLCWHAFGQNDVKQGYKKIAEKVVQYAKGVPLALMVLGSELKRKTTSQWEDALEKLKSISHFEIQKILRISFDGLDRDERNIFLDIACFLKGKRRDYLEIVLEAFGFHAKVGINRFIDKSLLKEEEEDGRAMITMHDLIEKMGKEIVAEEKESKGQQSRLWKFDCIKDALTNNRGTENVEVISLDHGHGNYPQIDINHEAFIRMSKLRFLNLKSKVNCPMGLEVLPNCIKYLCWYYYPLNYLPSNYNTEKLVHLNLHGSRLKEIVWSKPLMNLRSLILDECSGLKKISDLALAPNLEKICLLRCYDLVEVGSSLENLNKLTSLNVGQCSCLSSLPELPSSIKKLNLEMSGLRRLPSTIWRLTHLKRLSLQVCGGLESLPSCISSMSSLENISMHYCRDLKKLPEDFGNLESLKELDASYSGLEELPPSIQNLKRLIKLRLRCCRHLIKLPEDFGNLESLEELDASFSGLEELPQSITNLKKLIKLYLKGCAEIQNLPVLPSNLEVFDARSCNSLLSGVSSSVMDLYLRKTLDQPTKVHRFCVSGSQVPEWMMYRNYCGSSISLELETHGHSVDFIFCLVVPSDLHGRCRYLDLVAILVSDETSETARGCVFKNEKFFIYDIEDMHHTDDVYLWNGNRFDRNFVKKVSFALFDGNNSLDLYEEKIKWGVHPIFHHNNYRKRTHPDDHEEDPNLDLDLHL